MENFAVIAFDKATKATVDEIMGPGAVYYDEPWLQGKKVCGVGVLSYLKVLLKMGRWACAAVVLTLLPVDCRVPSSL